MKWVGIMEGKGLGKRINMVRKDRGFASPSQQEIAVAMIRAVLERKEG